MENVQNLNPVKPEDFPYERADYAAVAGQRITLMQRGPVYIFTVIGWKEYCECRCRLSSAVQEQIRRQMILKDGPFLAKVA